MNATLTRAYANNFRLYANNTIKAAGFATTACNGLKAAAKVAKSGSEAIMFLHETYEKAPSKGVLSVKTMASNFTDVFSLLEPVVLIQECVSGDKNGKRPWDYVKDQSYKKSVSWACKKTKGCTKFVKYLHTLRIINATCFLTPFNIVKLVCDIVATTICVVDRGVAYKNSLDQSAKLEKRLEKWNVRQQDKTAEDEVCSEKIQQINDKIKMEEKIRKKHAFKIACAIGLLALTIICFIALSVQMPYVNIAIMVIGFAINLAGFLKFGANFFKDNEKPKVTENSLVLIPV